MRNRGKISGESFSSRNYSKYNTENKKMQKINNALFKKTNTRSVTNT